MKRLAQVLTVVLACVLVAYVSTAVADKGSPGTGHVGICHKTGNSQAHEFIYIEPDASGVYDGHVGHQYADDIIPAFSYVNAHGQTISFGGQNLGTDYDGVTGQQLLDNHCNRPNTPPPPTTGTTTTQTVTTTVTTPPPPPKTVTTTVTTPAPPTQTVTVTTTVIVSPTPIHS